MALLPALNIILSLFIFYILKVIKQKTVRRVLRVAVIIIGPVLMVDYLSSPDQRFTIGEAIFVTLIIYLLSGIALAILYSVGSSFLEGTENKTTIPKQQNGSAIFNESKSVSSRILSNSPVGRISKTVASELNRMDSQSWPLFYGGNKEKFDIVLQKLQIVIFPKAKDDLYKSINENPLLFTLFLITFHYKRNPQSLLSQLNNVRQIIIENFEKHYGEYKEKGCLQPIHGLDFQEYHCQDWVLTWLRGY